VLGFMADGLAKFRANPPVVKDVAALQHTRLAPPAGASVVRVYSRILPTPEGCNDNNKNLQRDHVWILKEEVRLLAKGEVAEPLRLRLLRFALVDAVRGEPDFWTVADIKQSEFRATTGNGAVAVHASFSMQTAKQTLSGTMDLEIKTDGDEVTHVKGYAACTASGSGTWTPGAPEGKFPLKFAFVLAPQTKDTVPPQAAMYGREYLTGR
jgi:hypothetical protein